MITRRQLMKRGAAGGAGFFLSRGLLAGSALGAPSVATSLKPYVDPMPLLADNAIDATTYTLEINGIVIAFTSGVGATLGSIRDGLITQARSIQELEGVVSFNPTGADSLRVTAVQPGTPFTPTETDVNLSNAAVTANVATVVLPFGHGVVRRTAGANVTAKSVAIPSATGQDIMGVTTRIHSNVDPTSADPANQQGAVSPFQDASIVHEGQVWVEVDEAVAAGDPVFMRHTAGGTGPGVPGSFRQDADTARADQLAGAKFESATTGVGLARVSLNLA